MHSFGVIFDIDGTAVDNHAHHEEAWLLWGERNNKPIDRAFYRDHLYARTNERIFRTLYGDAISPEEIVRRAADKEAIYREIYGPVMQPMPGLVKLLTALKQADIPCAAASNAERVNVDFVVDGLELRPFFPVVLASEDVKHGKPEPDLPLLAARRMGIPPARCLVFEDSWAGFEAAHRADMSVVAITGHSRAAALPPYVLAQFQDFRAVTLDMIAAFPTGNKRP